MQGEPFFEQPLRGSGAGGAVQALVGDFVEPGSHLGVGGGDVQFQAGLLEAGPQRQVEGAAQVAVEAFDLAFGPRPIGSAELDDEAAVAGVVEKAGVVAVLAFAIGVAFEDDRLHVVVEHLPGHAAKAGEGVFVAGNEGVHLHVTDEFNLARPAASQGGAEGVERPRAFAEFDPVDLHLGAGFGFESNHGIGWRHRLEVVHEGAQLAGAALVAERGDLPVQHAGRDPVGVRGGLSLAQVGFMGGQLAGAFGFPLIAR